MPPPITHYGTKVSMITLNVAGFRDYVADNVDIAVGR